MIRFRLPALFLLPAALLAPSAGFAAVPETNATSTARLIHPLSLIKLADLDFGGISSTGPAGTVIINPDTNAVTYTGGLMASGGSAHPAQFMGAAVKRTVVNIRLPKQPIALTREGGTETLTVSSWTLQGQNKRELAAKTTFTFAVGATIAVPANPVEGTYTGTFDIEVQYP